MQVENINKTLEEYYEALNRLIDNNPINVPKNSKINKDTVALEAGRKRGSIKKSREVFLDLIEAIEKASEDKSKSTSQHIEQITKLKDKINNYKHLYEEALNRELMYLERINELEKALKNISSNKIISANNLEAHT
jgi:ribulose kinase